MQKFNGKLTCQDKTSYQGKWYPAGQQARKELAKEKKNKKKKKTQDRSSRDAPDFKGLDWRMGYWKSFGLETLWYLQSVKIL